MASSSWNSLGSDPDQFSTIVAAPGVSVKGGVSSAGRMIVSAVAVGQPRRWRGDPMRRKIGMGLLYVAGSLVIGGSMYDLFVPSVPSTHLAYLGVTPTRMDPKFASLDLGLLR